MIVLEWLFLTIAPCDAAEPWQLGSQDAATPMMQGIIDLHHDIFFFLILILVFVSWILVRRNINMDVSILLALVLSRKAASLLIILVYLGAWLLTTNLAYCMDPPPPIPPVVAQEPLLDQVDPNILHQCKEILQAHEDIADKILELRTQERGHRCGGFQAELIVEKFEAKYGGPKLLEIKTDLREKGCNSPYFKESKALFQDMRADRVTDKGLRQEWQGR